MPQRAERYQIKARLVGDEETFHASINLAGIEDLCRNLWPSLEWAVETKCLANEEALNLLTDEIVKFIHG